MIVSCCVVIICLPLYTYSLTNILRTEYFWIPTFKKNNLKNFFIFDCAGSFLLHRLFSSCSEWGLVFIALLRLLIAVASFVANWGHRASVVVASRLKSCGSWALAQRLSSCGQWAQLLRGIWNLFWIRDRTPVSALVGGFFTTEPPGKPLNSHFYNTSLAQ